MFHVKHYVWFPSYSHIKRSLDKECRKGWRWGSKTGMGAKPFRAKFHCYRAKLIWPVSLVLGSTM
jgi:hypothetical protein